MIIEEKLNDDIIKNENTMINPFINNKKPKLAKALIGFLAIVFVITLLVGLFKLDIFQNKDNIIDTKRFTELRLLDFPFNDDDVLCFNHDFSIFDKKISIKYLYAFKDEFAYGYLKIKTDEDVKYVGIKKNVYNTNKNSITRNFGELDLFTFKFEKIPGVYMTMTFMGTCTITTIFNQDENRLQIDLYCDLKVKAKVSAGFEKVKSISGGASGTLVRGNFQGIISPREKGCNSDNKNVYGENIKVYVDGIDLENEKFHYEIVSKDNLINDNDIFILKKN